ncbi:HNH endonuclease signature motif containing protein [uncultured Brachybacterium sp.]|uniref:HNH endonuclease signature motif containing protein n=1 Tax=uncultured Brachybacterium sp. TaxID=189680 RepID=UPI0026239E78|nr:HNH endonuclease signature motif containing protein [uncultured Brachybacterium sp.]
MGEFEEDQFASDDADAAGEPLAGIPAREDSRAAEAPADRDAAAAGSEDPADPGAATEPGSPAMPGTAPEGLPAWSVRARRVLDEECIIEEATPGSLDAGRVLDLHRTMRFRASLRAHQLRQLSTFFREDPEVQGLLDDADITALKVAAGLRCTYPQAHAQVRDAHLAVQWMPVTFTYLRRGELPEQWHHYLIRHTRRLTEDQARDVDAHMAGIEIPSVSQDTFEKHVRLAVALATAGSLPAPPSQSRNVEIVGVDTDTGTASLMVTGPIPEIQALAHRLDVAARTVQRAQRHALEAGVEGPLPFDIDRDLAERGTALSLRTLRYAILTHSVLDIDPVQETSRPYKILVTVPALTLMGHSDAPAMLDGMTPLPAQLARELAAGESTWQRILTDPITGAYLPVTAETYTPTAQMRLQLRLRHPVCAVPGCVRATVLAAEDDHIIEYDHDHPGQGGQTSLWNLHRLCWLHHKQKTAGLIDPARDPADDPAHGDGTTTAGPLETVWDIGRDIRLRAREDTDLVTPRLARTLERDWRTYQRAHEDAVRLHAEEKTRPRQERAAEDRRAAWARHRGRRIIPPGPTHHETEPPF